MAPNDIINRRFFSGSNKCASGCLYCFSKWGKDYTNQSYFDVKHITEKQVILYPCCDEELLQQTEILEKLKAVSNEFEKMYISFSTKNNISKKQFDLLENLNKYLTDRNKGFVKISISVTTKTRINEIEPDTLSYSKRILLADEIVDRNFKHSVTLKPLLPFIDLNEYTDIIDDFKNTRAFLFGELYINPNTNFYKDYIHNKFPISCKTVKWLEGEPVWNYIDQMDRIQYLNDYVSGIGKQSFHSDYDLMMYFKNNN